MPVGLLGRKIGMTQVYDDQGVSVPVTVLEVGPCTVLQVKTRDRDGYEAVQVGFDDKLSDADKARPVEQRNRSRANRAERGHVAVLKSKRQKRLAEAGVEGLPKADCEPQRFVREFRVDGEEHGCQVGQVLGPALLDGVGQVDVVGVSKGRGFTGVMKRHNFGGKPSSHGAKKNHRSAGGIGARTDPSRCWKGKRMAGHYGSDRVTTRNLKLVRVDSENNVILVRGAVPGPNGGYVMVRKAK